MHVDARGTSIAKFLAILYPEKPMLPCRVSLRLALCLLSLGLTASLAPAQQRTDFGTLSIQVRPPDAEIFIDGERWTGSGESGRPFQVQLSPGTHRVELRSPGRQTFSRDITIRAGETTPLNVALAQGESADTPPPPPPPPPFEHRPPTAPAPSSPSSGIVRTATEDGFVIAPDYRVTEINHHTAQMVGAYGGYVFAKQLLIGAGGYWQADTTDGARMFYTGPVVEWRLFPDSTIGLNLHGLVGGGWRYLDDNFYYWQIRSNRFLPPPGTRTFPRGWYNDGFFVAEPEAQIVWRVGSWARVQGGVGYRATSTDGLSGASGSVSVQFGR
jgi:PEGA domain